MAYLQAFVRFLGSFGLAVATLLAMLGLTFIGTLAQRTVDPYIVQSEFFESFFFEQKLFGAIPFYLPGGLLLLSILFINLIVGGLIRLRYTWSRVGIMIIHVGIAVLLLGNLVEYLRSTKGHMVLHEGEASDEFESYYDWEIALLEPMPDGSERAHIIPGEQFEYLEDGGVATFTSENVPFEFEVNAFVPHCRPDRVRGRDGKVRFVLKPQPFPKETERRMAGISVVVRPKTEEPKETVLWYANPRPRPWVVEVGGKPWGVLFRKRTYQVPFEVKLIDFQHEYHPGTPMAKRYSSDVVRSAGAIAEDVHIAMNEPMRSDGYIFYQSGWGRSGGDGKGPIYSDFSVVFNPSDQVPLYAVWVIGIGLGVHLIWKLILYILGQRGARRAATA